MKSNYVFVLNKAGENELVSLLKANEQSADTEILNEISAARLQYSNVSHQVGGHSLP